MSSRDSVTLPNTPASGEPAGDDGGTPRPGDSSAETTPAGGTPEDAGPPGAVARLRRRLPDLAAIGCYLMVALLVGARLWRDPDGRASQANPNDQALFEWMFAHAARSITHLENPLLSTRMSTPLGLNTMANTSVFGLSIPLTPVTLLWGPSVSYLVVLTLALAGTATAWYFVLSRYVTPSRVAAFAGAGFCGFAPGIVSQSTGHLQIATQFLVPLIIWGVFRLRETTRPLRDGLILGVLIAYQIFIGEEVLFIVAWVCAVCLAGYLLMRRAEAIRAWRGFTTGLGVAGLVTLLLTAYPLYHQFFGPQHYRTVPGLQKHGADVLGYVSYSPLSFGGDPSAPLELARNPSELNAFFGWPLLLMVVAMVWWLRRHLAVRLAAIVAVIFGLFSLGHDILIGGEYTGVPGPWWPFAQLPIFDAVVTSRLAIVVAAAIGVIIAVAVQELVRDRTRATPVRIIWALLLVVALLPLTPRPLPATGVAPIPAVLADGGWRQYLGPDEALMVAPPTHDNGVLGMTWSAAERLELLLTHGYFLGPDPNAEEEGMGIFDTPHNATDRLLTQTARTGTAPVVTDEHRAQAREDLAHRNTGLIVMRARQRNADEVRTTLDALVGPGRLAGDVWLWDLPPAN